MNKIKFTLEAGVLIRGSVETAIRNAAFSLDLELKMEEDRGFLSSNFRVVATGSDDKLLVFQRKVKRIMDHFGDL